MNYSLELKANQKSDPEADTTKHTNIRHFANTQSTCALTYASAVVSYTSTLTHASQRVAKIQHAQHRTPSAHTC